MYNLNNKQMLKYGRNNMPKKVRQKKLRKIKQGPKMVDCGALKHGVGGASPGSAPVNWSNDRLALRYGWRPSL